MMIVKKLFSFSFIFKIATILSLTALFIVYLTPYVHPETFWLIPFFGLGYPVILLINLAWVIIWLFFNRRWSLICLLAILLGGKLHFRFTNISKNDEIPTKKAIKILSFNVKNFDVYTVGFTKNYKNRDGIFKQIKEIQPEIVCFQEFYSQDAKNSKTYFPTKDTIHQLIDAPFFHDRMSFNKQFKNFFGVAIFSKYPMINKGFIELDTSIRNSNNFCIFTDVIIEKDTIRIYNTHFQSIRFQEDEYALFNQKEYTGNEKSGIISIIKKIHKGYQKRADQAKLVVEHMLQSPFPVVICGDFNDTPMSFVYNTFYSNFIDAFRNSSLGFGFTYAGKVPAGRIDYIFHDKTIGSRNFKIEKEIFSDHKAISCEIWKK